VAGDARDGIELGWSDATVPLHTHACFYYADEQTLKVTLSFLRLGLESEGDFNVLFADRNRHELLLGWLQDGLAGDVGKARDAGKLAVIGAAPTREELLAGIGSTLEAALTRGHRRIRFLGFIGWGEPGWPDEDELLEFESQVNAAVMAYPAVIICTYGVPNLTGRQLVNGGLMTHPVVFLNGRTLTESPLYLAPAIRTAGPPAGRSG